MNLQYYKQNVSIIQLVEALGYTYNRNKGRHPKQYEHPNGDKVIIYDKAKSIGESYFTRNKHNDKGSVIDFVKNRLSMFNVHYHTEWEGVLKVLGEFTGSSSDQIIRKPVIDRKSIKTKQEFDPGLFEVRPATLKDLSYLSFERKLNEDTLNKFLPYIQTVRRKGKYFTNIGFPYTIPGRSAQVGNDKVQGFELVNHMFKQHAKGSQRKQAVWVADLSHARQLVGNVYIGESAIDVMSFYQLYQHKYNFENAVFISAGGNVLRNQVINTLKAFPNAKINTLFDNDFSGKMYDIYLASIKADKEIEIRKANDAVQIKMKKGTFEIPVNQISLARFERVTGIRSGVRAFKADGKDFNEMLQKRSELNADLNSKSGLKR